MKRNSYWDKTQRNGAVAGSNRISTTHPDRAMGTVVFAYQISSHSKVLPRCKFVSMRLGYG
jgi:hypothetical protein